MAAETRGVFTLKTVRNNILNDEFVTPDETFSNNITSSPNVGYYAGGLPSPNKSSTEKINYGTDTTTAVPSANLQTGRYNVGAVGNQNKGYLMGGAPSLSTADKLSYATETYAGTVPLPYARQYACGTGNDNVGYLGGGDGAATVSIVDKMVYGVDASFSLPSASLSAARTYLSSSTSPSAGYYGGGYASGPTYYSRMDKLAFSTETTAYIPAGNLSKSIYGMVATGDSSASYWGGGYSSGAFQSGVDKLTYSTDTTAALPASSNLSLEKIQRGSLSASTAGYYSGGTPGSITTTDKFTFSTETASVTPTAATTIPLYATTGVSPRNNTGNPLPTTGYVASTQNLKGVPLSNTGYFGGGAGPLTTMDKVDYSTDAAGRVPGASLSVSRDGVMATGNSTSGYFGGGSPGPVSTMDKLTYLTDTTAAVPGAALSFARYNTAATGNITAGYFAGGRVTPTSYSTMDKLTYSTNTTAAVPSAALSAAIASHVAIGNQTSGYFTGGWNYPGNENRTDKLSYSTDTRAAIPSAYLNTARYGALATGSKSAGYISGGTNEPTLLSSTEKLVFSTDAMSALPSASLPAASGNTGSTSSSSSGYIVRGASSPTLSIITKLNFTTDTMADVSSRMSVARYAFDGVSGVENGLPQKAAPTPTLGVTFPTSTPNTGYVAGGGPGPKTSYEKLSYSTETQNIVPGQNLTIARGLIMGGTSSSTAGYTSGGYNGGTRYSTTDKITYSTDTATGVPGAALTGTGRYGHATSSSSSAGYNVGGYTTGAIATADKTTFSSDTTAALPSSANLSATRYYYQGGGGPNAGYFSMGIVPSRSSSTDKLVYSTDTTSIIPSANMPDQRAAGSGIANSYAVYFAGGNDASSNFPTSGYKLDYSTDTQRTIGGVLNDGRYYFQSIGNELAGYWTGGQNPGGEYTWTNKLTYSTEVGQLVPTAYQTTTRSGGGGQSARTNGVVAGVPNIL